MTKQMAQTVILTLSDGRKGKFVGPVLITPEEIESGKVYVRTPIELTPPWPLRDGAYFADMKTGLPAPVEEE